MVIIFDIYRVTSKYLKLCIFSNLKLPNPWYSQWLSCLNIIVYWIFNLFILSPTFKLFFFWCSVPIIAFWFSDHLEQYYHPLTCSYSALSFNVETSFCVFPMTVISAMLKGTRWYKTSLRWNSVLIFTLSLLSRKAKLRDVHT